MAERARSQYGSSPDVPAQPLRPTVLVPFRSRPVAGFEYRVGQIGAVIAGDRVAIKLFDVLIGVAVFAHYRCGVVPDWPALVQDGVSHAVESDG